MALACAASPSGRDARFLDFWRFPAVFCPDTGILVFKAAPRVSRPAARVPMPAQFARRLSPGIVAPRSDARENFKKYRRPRPAFFGSRPAVIFAPYVFSNPRPAVRGMINSF